MDYTENKPGEPKSKGKVHTSVNILADLHQEATENNISLTYATELGVKLLLLERDQIKYPFDFYPRWLQHRTEKFIRKIQEQQEELERLKKVLTPEFKTAQDMLTEEEADRIIQGAQNINEPDFTTAAESIKGVKNGTIS